MTHTHKEWTRAEFNGALRGRVDTRLLAVSLSLYVGHSAPPSSSYASKHADGFCIDISTMAMTAPAGGHQAPPAYHERDLPPLPDLGDVHVASVQVSSGAAPPVPSKLPVEVTETVLQYSPQGNDSLSPLSGFSRDTPPEAGPSSHSNRPSAISKKHLTVSGKEPLSTTLYLDPSLSSLIPINIPGTSALASVADTALSTLQKYPDGTFNWTTGAPIGGMAGLAKQYVLPPDIKVTGENGNVWLRVGIVDERRAIGSVEEEEGKNKKGKSRSRGRVDVVTNRGGVVVEVVSDRYHTKD